MDIKVSSSDEGEFSKNLERSANEYRKGVKLMMFRALTILEAAIISNIRRNFRVGTGRLINSIANSKVVRDLDDMTIEATIGPVGVPYGAIHEFGGTILPKKKFLAIPLDPVKGPDGVARAKPLDFRGRSRFAVLNGKLFLMVKEGDTWTPYFLMKPSVKMPDRPYLRPALEKNRERIAQKFGLFLEGQFNFDGPQKVE